MSRFSISASLGAFAVVGAVTLGAGGAAIASTETAHLSAKSAGCPALSTITKAAGVKLDKPKVVKAKSSGLVSCTYVNTTSGIAVVVEPKLSTEITTAEFNRSINAAAKQYGHARVHKITKAGKAAAYFEMPKADDVLGRRDYFGAVDGKKHLIGLGDNQSAMRMIKLARAIG
jgi:hypothetical protein